jgi:hypothetical protein
VPFAIQSDEKPVRQHRLQDPAGESARRQVLGKALARLATRRGPACITPQVEHKAAVRLACDCPGRALVAATSKTTARTDSSPVDARQRGLRGNADISHVG